MRISLDLAWVVTALLSSLRVGTVFVLTPLLTMGNIPVRFRVLFVLALSATLVAAMGVPGVIPGYSLSTLIAAAFGELVLGALMAFGLIAGFATYQLAGRIMDMQLGFGVAALIDPTTRAQVPLLGTLLFMAAVVGFFAIDGHHLVIRALAYSFERIPPGTQITEVNLAAVTAQFGLMFTFAVAISAPVIFILLMVDTALAVMARTMPQMNVFFLSLPLKILIGLFVLVLSVRYVGPVTKRLFESMFGYLEQIIG